ncbi:hypothetical protein P3X46_003836 [Hevea brasiliensis]|uniref:Uncharacterized protein n=1 Tax=Hevea brasiliensis TaxID=3981 RepID=A0ABQ9N9M9_HEVBR|nr:root meristem growth factor 10 [Hevea brasiliensis]KAJ9188480.1 hypothetical protein P3X46_003836 [Hevea brasiliensis]
MSVVSCLLPLLLCLSLHACNARRIATADQKFHISNQNDEKKVSVTVPMESSSSNEPAGAAKEDSIAETHHLDGYAQKLKNSKPKQKLMAEENAKNSGSAEKKSLVSVPWRVPHNKRGEKHPGFNFDYSPPKTHPPSHN